MAKMSTKYWIKLYHEILHDPKMATLPADTWRLAIECFLMAGEAEKGGYLPSLKDMAWTLRRDIEQLETVLHELIQIEVIEMRDGRYFVRKFQDRQEPLPKAEYNRRRRENEALHNYYQPVTNGNQDTDIDTDIDKESEKKNGAKAPSPSRIALQENRNELVKYFMQKTGLPCIGDIKAKQKLWWSPADEIYKDLAGEDMDKAKQIIDKAIFKMRDLTYADMHSILKTARSVYAESNRPDQHQYDVVD